MSEDLGTGMMLSRSGITDIRDVRRSRFLQAWSVTVSLWMVFGWAYDLVYMRGEALMIDDNIL